MRGNLSIREAQRAVAAYLAAKGPTWSGLGKPYYLLTHLTEEVGELARSVINLEARAKEPRRRGLAASRAEKRAALRDGIGDVFYQLAKLCVAYDVDLQDAFESSFETIRTKYPAGSGVRGHRR